MDNNIKWFNEQKILRTIEALKKNKMNGYLVNDNKELISKIEELTAEGSKVACGGSMTLFETGVIEHLRSGRYDFLDRYKEGITREEAVDIYRKALLTDVYFVSTNAITEQGELYNVDGTGNRVAAMLYGPKKVIVVCGVNKIVANLEEAISRVKNTVAPINSKRLNRNTPCAKCGKCMDCSSEDRICNEYTVIKRQADENRIHVIFLNEELGY